MQDVNERFLNTLTHPTQKGYNYFYFAHYNCVTEGNKNKPTTNTTIPIHTILISK